MNETKGLYLVKCDRCRADVGRTDDLQRSAAGSRCGTCRMLLGWLKGNFSRENIDRTARFWARAIPQLGGVRFLRERMKTAVNG